MIEGCNETARAKGLCTRHYLILYRELSDISVTHLLIGLAFFGIGIFTCFLL